MDLMSFMESMGTNNVSVIAAFFIGLMSALSPCTLATNVSAVAYVSRNIKKPKSTLLIGLLYTLGRVMTYTAIAAAIVYAGLSEQTIALSLQQYGAWLIGPIMLFVGFVMLEIIKPSRIKLPQPPEKIGRKFSDGSYLGAFILGVFFALAFCPFSAVLYFGMMIPLALQTRDAIMIPTSFAIATGIPVIFFALLAVLGAQKIGEAMKKIRLVEYVVRKLSAAIFILIGIYYIITALFPGAI